MRTPPFRAATASVWVLRALFFGEPRLVVLDEPNASLDYVGERVLYDAIEQMKAANITVIIITHRMGILAATSKIAIMQDGTVSAFGDSQEIFDRYLSRPHIPSSENAPAQVDVSPEPRSRVRRTRKRLNGLAAQSDGPAS